MTTEKCWPPESNGFDGAPGPDATKMFAISRTFHHKPVMMFTWVLSDVWGRRGGCSLQSLHPRQGLPTGCGVPGEAEAVDPEPLLFCWPQFPDGTGQVPI